MVEADYAVRPPAGGPDGCEQCLPVDLVTCFPITIRDVVGPDGLAYANFRLIMSPKQNPTTFVGLVTFSVVENALDNNGVDVNGRLHYRAKLHTLGQGNCCGLVQCRNAVAVDRDSADSLGINRAGRFEAHAHILRKAATNASISAVLVVKPGDTRMVPSGNVPMAW